MKNTLRSLQIEFQNISEITKKINQNNLYKSQLESIDLGLAKEYVSENEWQDTEHLLQQIGEIKSQGSQEVRMVKKYTGLTRCRRCRLSYLWSRDRSRIYRTRVTKTSRRQTTAYSAQLELVNDNLAEINKANLLCLNKCNKR